MSKTITVEFDEPLHEDKCEQVEDFVLLPSGHLEIKFVNGDSVMFAPGWRKVIVIEKPSRG